MPGWHEKISEWDPEGKIRVWGIVQEQHPDRARLFMQWKQLPWPIAVDSLNLLGISAVPITLLLDEEGIIRAINPKQNEFLDFLNQPSPKTIPAPSPETEDQQLPPPTDALQRAQHDFLWQTPRNLDSILLQFHQALESNSPLKASIHFQAGVAYRTRFDSPTRHAQDFQNAIHHWQTALELNPNQYIWRRRIQQYGPRLDKPYSFYDWVHTARSEIMSRGQTPLPLIVEPGGAEFATPPSQPTTPPQAQTDQTPPSDPQGRILRDLQPLIQIETTLVPSTQSGPPAYRLHLLLTPNQSLKAHWNNETDPLVIWIDSTILWTLSTPWQTHPNPPETIDTASRSLEFEVKSNQATPPPTHLNGYALYYVCEGQQGTCLYLRQDFRIPLPPP